MLETRTRFKTPYARLQGAFLLLILVFTATVGGYMLFGFSLVDAIYMVVITMSTVGYEEVEDFSNRPGLKMYTVGVIIVGMTSAFYTMGGLIQLIAEGEIQRVLSDSRMNQKIQNLKQHIIVCGYGRTGQILAKELVRRQQSLVIIEHNAERCSEAKLDDLLVVQGDATEEDVLLAAGIDRAKTVVIVLSDDASNVFITLTARNLKHDLLIIARGEYASTHKKLIQAGANHVVLPASIGAMRMANMILRPSTTALMEQVAGPGSLNVHIAELDVLIEELHVTTTSKIINQSVVTAEVRRRFRLIIIGVKRASGPLAFNPGDEVKFAAGDTIIAMGRQDDLLRFEQEFHLARGN